MRVHEYVDKKNNFEFKIYTYYYYMLKTIPLMLFFDDSLTNLIKHICFKSLLL